MSNGDEIDSSDQVVRMAIKSNDTIAKLMMIAMFFLLGGAVLLLIFGKLYIALAAFASLIVISWVSGYRIRSKYNISE